MVITRSLEHPKLVELPGDEPQPYKPFQVLVPHKVRHVLTLSYYIVIPPIPPLRSPPPPHYRRSHFQVPNRIGVFLGYTIT